MELTPEQQKCVPIIHQKWVDRMTTPINLEAAQAAITAIYKEEGLEAPVYGYALSPKAAIELIYLMKKGEKLFFNSAVTNWDKKKVKAAGLNVDFTKPAYAELIRIVEERLIESDLPSPQRDAAYKDIAGESTGSLAVENGADNSAFLDKARQYLEVKTQALPEELRRALRDVADEALLNEWRQAWCSLYEIAKHVGVPFDEEKYQLYYNYCWEVQAIWPYEEVCIIVERPCVINWIGDKVGCEDGPAIAYKDGVELYVLEDLILDKQIIMFPETLTIQQIKEEDNAEKQRIMLNRYGWTKYLLEVGARPLDSKDITLEGGTIYRETLWRSEDYTVLVTYDPSTGRPYALEVSEDCTTTAEAQRYLNGIDIVSNVFGLEPAQVNTYPVLRT